MTEQQVLAQIHGILSTIESKLHLIGNRITDDAKLGAKTERGGRPYIYDTHRFYDNLDYEVTVSPAEYRLTAGSRAPYAQYVLGGKVPSWTPLEPILTWVERKNLQWTTDSGRSMTTLEMAQAIVYSIRKRGIPERNIMQEVIMNREYWIRKVLSELV